MNQIRYQRGEHRMPAISNALTLGTTHNQKPLTNNLWTSEIFI